MVIVLPYLKKREKNLLRNLSKMRVGSKQFEDQKNRLLNLKMYGVLSRGKKGRKGVREESSNGGNN
jgi:hypothetical protein